MLVNLSAVVYAVLMGVVMLFQLGLALGMPWGAASMGGKFPGKYPPKMRVAALTFIPILGFLIIIVLVRADLLWPELRTASAVGIWLVVIFSAVSVVLNIISRSKIERKIWIPVTVLHLTTSIIVALS